MNLKHVLSAGLGLFALGFVASTAQAAPVVGPEAVAGPEAAGTSLVEKTHWRYRYRYYRPYYYNYGYPYYYDYYYYPRYYYPRHRRHHHHHRYW